MKTEEPGEEGGRNRCLVRSYTLLVLSLSLSLSYFSLIPGPDGHEEDTRSLPTCSLLIFSQSSVCHHGYPKPAGRCVGSRNREVKNEGRIGNGESCREEEEMGGLVETRAEMERESVTGS